MFGKLRLVHVGTPLSLCSISRSNENSLYCATAGYLFSLNHARLVVLMATVYALYCVKVQVGWFGVFLSINLAFLSNDLLNYLLLLCDNVSENSHVEEQKEPETVTEDEFSGGCEYSIPTEEPEKLHSCKSSSKSAATASVINSQKESFCSKVVKEETNSIDEMKRILNSTDHYETLGFPRQKKIDATVMKKEYRKKVYLAFGDEVIFIYLLIKVSFFWSLFSHFELFPQEEMEYLLIINLFS